MRKLICLISTEGKKPEQIAAEAWKAYQKYRKVERANSKRKPRKQKQPTENTQDQKVEAEITFLPHYRKKSPEKPLK